MVRADYDDLSLAFDFVSSAAPLANRAWLEQWNPFEAKATEHQDNDIQLTRREGDSGSPGASA